MIHLTDQPMIIDTPPTTPMPRAIGLMAGTFDPIHQGHLGIADVVWKTIPLQTIEFIPNHAPPHREAPQASADHRATMVTLAIADRYPDYRLNRIELDRPGPSYMIDTLALLKSSEGNTSTDTHYHTSVDTRTDTCHNTSADTSGDTQHNTRTDTCYHTNADTRFATQPLCLILGEDALLTLHTWRHWEHLIDYCHLIVVARPSYADPTHITHPDLRAFVNAHMTDTYDALQQDDRHVIVYLPDPSFNESATQIRDALRMGRSCRAQLPPAVWDYICRYQLYSNATF